MRDSQLHKAPGGMQAQPESAAGLAGLAGQSAGQFRDAFAKAALSVAGLFFPQVAAPPTMHLIGGVAVAAVASLTTQQATGQEPTGSSSAPNMDLLELIGQVERGDGIRALTAALKQIHQQTEAEVSQRAAPLASAVLNGLTEDYASSYIVEHLIQSDVLSDAGIKNLKAQLQDYQPARRCGELLRAALADNGSPEREFYEQFIKILPPETFADLQGALASAHTALKIDAVPSLEHSPRLLVGIRTNNLSKYMVPNHEPGTLEPQELIKVWKAVSDRLAADPHQLQTVAKAVIEQFFKTSDNAAWPAEKLRQLLKDAPPAFQEAAVLYVVDLSGKTRQASVIEALPPTLQGQHEQMAALYELVKSESVELRGVYQYGSMVAPYRGQWMDDVNRTRPASFKNEGAQEIAKALEDPYMVRQGEIFTSSLGAAYEAVRRPDSGLSDKTRADLKSLLDPLAKRDLAVLLDLNKHGALSQNQYVLGQLVIHLKYPGTDVSKALEPVVAAQLKNLDLEPLFSIATRGLDSPSNLCTSVLKKLHQIAERRLLLDPDFRSVCEVLIRSLPATTAEDQDVLMGNLDFLGHFVKIQAGSPDWAGANRSYSVLLSKSNHEEPDLEKSGLSISLHILRSLSDAASAENVADLAHKVLETLNSITIPPDHRAEVAAVYVELLRSQGGGILADERIGDDIADRFSQSLLYAVTSLLEDASKDQSPAPWRQEIQELIRSSMQVPSEAIASGKTPSVFYLGMLTLLEPLDAETRPIAAKFLANCARAVRGNAGDSSPLANGTSEKILRLWRDYQDDLNEKWRGELLDEMIAMLKDDAASPESHGQRAWLLLSVIASLSNTELATRITAAQEEDIVREVIPIAPRFLEGAQESKYLYWAALGVYLDFQNSPSSRAERIETLLTMVEEKQVPEEAAKVIMERITSFKSELDKMNDEERRQTLKTLKRVSERLTEALEESIAKGDVKGASENIFLLGQMNIVEDVDEISRLTGRVFDLIVSTEQEVQLAQDLELLVGRSQHAHVPGLLERLVAYAATPGLTNGLRSAVFDHVQNVFLWESEVQRKLPNTPMLEECRAAIESLGTIVKAHEDNGTRAMALETLLSLGHSRGFSDAGVRGTLQSLQGDPDVLAAFRRALEDKDTKPEVLKRLLYSVQERPEYHEIIKEHNKKQRER